MKNTRIPEMRIHNIVKSSLASTAAAVLMLYDNVVNSDI
jgi:hypothetical protein